MNFQTDYVSKTDFLLSLMQEDTAGEKIYDIDRKKLFKHVRILKLYYRSAFRKGPLLVLTNSR